MGFTGKGSNYTRLLISLVIMGLSSIFLGYFSFGAKISNLLLGVVILSAVSDVGRTRRLLMIGLVLGVPAFGTRLTEGFAPHKTLSLSVLNEAATVLVLAYVLYEIISDIATTHEVTSDTLRGAVSAYLLLGITWASAYQLVEILHPGSFAVNTAAHLPGRGPNLLYYSFVVLTTLGFGDITPVTTISRGLTWIEAVAGQLFIATTIARLVGLRLYREIR